MEPPDFGKCLPRPSNQVSSSAGPPKELLGLDGRYPVLSEDERTLVFQMYRKGQSGIWAADLSTGSLRKLSDDSSSHSDRHAIPIGESDELRVVFGRNNKRYERLMQLDMATGNIETLSIPPHLSASIAAEDEEGRILFAGSRVDQQGNPTSAPDLFRFDPETEDTEQLTNTEWEEWRPVVDPVTNDIYFIANPNGQFDIFRLDSRAQQSSIVFKSQSDEWDPDISPDGKWLVFASKKSGNFDLFLKRIDGQGGVIRLTSGVLDEWDPKFLPKGDAIVFAGSSGNDSPRMYYLCPFGERPN
jgi:TolB protein